MTAPFKPGDWVCYVRVYGPALRVDGQWGGFTDDVLLVDARGQVYLRAGQEALRPATPAEVLDAQLTALGGGGL